jgi:ribosome-binding ATPase YchF (GTP1/OBG family)
LTDKPVLYVANVDEASMHTGNKYSEALQAAAKAEGAEVIVMCNNIEAQIAEMEAEDDKQMFMEEYNMKEPALNRLITSAYKLVQPRYLFYRRCTGSKGMDHTQRLESAAGRQRDPY